VDNSRDRSTRGSSRLPLPLSPSAAAPSSNSFYSLPQPLCSPNGVGYNSAACALVTATNERLDFIAKLAPVVDPEIDSGGAISVYRAAICYYRHGEGGTRQGGPTCHQHIEGKKQRKRGRRWLPWEKENGRREWAGPVSAHNTG
jgi:hypothetical protein